MGHPKEKYNPANTIESKTGSVAQRFFDQAKKTDQDFHLDKRRFLSGVGEEVQSMNFDKAQRMMEDSKPYEKNNASLDQGPAYEETKNSLADDETRAFWTDEMRQNAVDINGLDRERRGSKPLTFDEALQGINEFGNILEKQSSEEGGSQDDLDSAQEIFEISQAAREPGIEGIDQALEYLEGTLKSQNNIAEAVLSDRLMTPQDKAEFLKQWQRKRDVRDALFEEKKKRQEKMNEGELIEQEQRRARTAAQETLQDLYEKANISEDVPSRQELLNSVGQMSSEEFRNFSLQLEGHRKKFEESQDIKGLDAGLFELSSKSFRSKDMVSGQAAEDAARINELRSELGINQGNDSETAEVVSGKVEKTTEGESDVEGKKEKGVERERMKQVFLGIYHSPEVASLFDVCEKHQYIPQKGFSAVVQVFKKLYPTPETFADRLLELQGDKDLVLENSRRENPDKDDHAQEAFAYNSLVKSLRTGESEALKGFLTENPLVSKGGEAGTSFSGIMTNQTVVEDFFVTLEKYKQRI